MVGHWIESAIFHLGSGSFFIFYLFLSYSQLIPIIFVQPFDQLFLSCFINKIILFVFATVVTFHCIQIYFVVKSFGFILTLFQKTFLDVFELVCKTFFPQSWVIIQYLLNLFFIFLCVFSLPFIHRFVIFIVLNQHFPCFHELEHMLLIFIHIKQYFFELWQGSIVQKKNDLFQFSCFNFLLVNHFPQAIDKVGFISESTILEFSLIKFFLGGLNVLNGLQNMGIMKNGDASFNIDEFLVIIVGQLLINFVGKNERTMRIDLLYG